MTRPELATVRAAILADIKRGLPVRDAAPQHGYSDSAVWSWAAADPNFAAELAHARRVGSPCGRRKVAYLAALASGDSCAVAASKVGVSYRATHDWRRTDPAFAAEYARLIGPHRSMVRRRRFDALLTRLCAGDPLADAMAALGYGPRTADWWRLYAPVQWGMVQRALAAGRALNGERGPC